MKTNKRHKYYGQTLLPDNDKRTLKRKRIIAIISLVAAIALFIAASVFLTRKIFSFEEGETFADAASKFRNMIRGYGVWGWLVGFGIQALQVIISPIPGEVVEVGMGLAFGWFWGALLCLGGAAFSAFLILLFVKKYGVRFVELFISVDRINELKFINTEKKLERAVLILYMLPGTPKDPLIFFFGLTKIRISDFIVLSTIARIPSVVTSTIGAEFLHNKNYVGAIILFATVGAVSLTFVILYKKILASLKSHGEKKKAVQNEETEQDEETEQNEETKKS